MACLGRNGGCAPEKTQILIVGAFASGKTTIPRLLSGKSHSDQTIPTLGLRLEKLEIEEYKVMFLDVGGKSELVPKWPLFYGLAQGIVYSIDSTDMKNAEVNAKHLVKILEHPDVEGKPFLIAGTKSRLENAMREDQLLGIYDIDNLLSRHRNAQFCFAEDKPHWIRSGGNSSDECILMAAKSNMSVNKNIEQSKQLLKFSKSETENVNQNALVEGETGGREAAESKDLDLDPDQDLDVSCNKGVNIITPKPSERYLIPYGDPDLNEPTVIIELMGLREGMLWLLEFIDGNRVELSKRIAKANKENNVVSTKRKLMKIQRKWERQCAKTGFFYEMEDRTQKIPGIKLSQLSRTPLSCSPSRFLAVSPASRLFVQQISQIDVDGRNKTKSLLRMGGCKSPSPRPSDWSQA